MSVDERIISEILEHPVYVDGVYPNGIYDLGDTFATIYYRYVPTMKNGLIVLDRVPCHCLIRQKAGAAADTTLFLSIVNGATKAPPAPQPLRMTGLHS